MQLPQTDPKKPMYIHLTTHSAFSLQEGLLPPAGLVQAARASGMPVLGLTDRNLLTGTIEFVAACRDANIQPIIGLEIHLNDGPLSLLATSLDGWSNLCRLSSAIALRGDPDAPCPLDVLTSYSKDLIALSRRPEQLMDVFPIKEPSGYTVKLGPLFKHVWTMNWELSRAWDLSLSS